MSNDMMSLDEIIQKNKSDRESNKGKGSTMRNRGQAGKPARNDTGGPKTNGAVAKSTAPKRMQDARLRIIQKKRTHITDARDKLAQLAKQSDARLKLQKLRATDLKNVDSFNISRKTARNGRISLSTNKPLPSRSPRSLSSAFIPPPSRPMNYRSPPIPDAAYVNDLLLSYNNSLLLDQAAVRRSITNDYTPTLPPPPPVFNIKPVLSYNWDKPSHSGSLSRSTSTYSSDHTRPRDYKVIPRTGMNKIGSSSYKNDWVFGSKSRAAIPDSLIASKYYPIKNSRDGVKSRLDSPPSKSSRATSSSRPKSSQSTGYRIVVSNLQANVTQEDIKELFEDVGELLVSRLVRPGIAEVIYKTMKDATKAVETYHNRQLDGHPMKCLLVNPRTKTSSSTPSSGRVLSQNLKF